MSLILEAVGRGRAIGSYPLRESAPVLVGRSRDCTIRLSDPNVSRHHCRLSCRHGKWHVEDLGSINGTRVNHRKVQWAELAEGDVLSFGKLHFCVRSEDSRRTQVVDPPGLGPPDGSPCRTAAGTARDPAQPLRPFADRYELNALIHQGLTGTFHSARDLPSGQTVCLKVLARSVAADEPELRRFVRGVQTAAKLEHPNIVQLYRAGKWERQWWLAMEYVDGPSLRQVLARQMLARPAGANRLAPAQVMAIAQDIGAALEAACACQVLHRNIKPANILLTKAGVAKLSNFALARGVVLTTLHQITAAGELVGDLAFMAPERAEPGGAVDGRADIYALGASLYTLLAGRPPFTGHSRAHLIEQVRHEPPVPPSRISRAVPGPLEEVVLKCLAKSPTDRFQTPMELRAELARVARFQPV